MDNFNKAKLLFNEGIKFLHEKKYLDSERKFMSSLNLLPERISIVGNLFTIYFNTNNKSQLKILLDKYKNYSDKKEILYGEAINFYFDEKFSESIKICNKLIKFNDIEIFILDLLALNYQKKFLLLDSLKILRIRLNKKKDSSVYYNLGNFFYALRRYPF